MRRSTQRQRRNYIKKRDLLKIDKASDDRYDDDHPHKDGHPAAQHFLSCHKCLFANSSVDDPKRQLSARLAIFIACKYRGRKFSICSASKGDLYYIKCFKFHILARPGPDLLRSASTTFESPFSRRKTVLFCSMAPFARPPAVAIARVSVIPARE